MAVATLRIHREDDEPVVPLAAAEPAGTADLDRDVLLVRLGVVPANRTRGDRRVARRELPEAIAGFAVVGDEIAVLSAGEHKTGRGGHRAAPDVNVTVDPLAPDTLARRRVERTDRADVTVVLVGHRLGFVLEDAPPVLSARLELLEAPPGFLGVVVHLVVDEPGFGIVRRRVPIATAHPAGHERAAPPIVDVRDHAEHVQLLDARVGSSDESTAVGVHRVHPAGLARVDHGVARFVAVGVLEVADEHPRRRRVVVPHVVSRLLMEPEPLAGLGVHAHRPTGVAVRPWSNRAVEVRCRVADRHVEDIALLVVRRRHPVRAAGLVDRIADPLLLGTGSRLPLDLAGIDVDCAVEPTDAVLASGGPGVQRAVVDDRCPGRGVAAFVILGGTVPLFFPGVSVQGDNARIERRHEHFVLVDGRAAVVIVTAQHYVRGHGVGVTPQHVAVSGVESLEMVRPVRLVHDRRVAGYDDRRALHARPGADLDVVLDLQITDVFFVHDVGRGVAMHLVVSTVDEPRLRVLAGFAEHLLGDIELWNPVDVVLVGD